jgi:hypothetical protein
VLAGAVEQVGQAAQDAAVQVAERATRKPSPTSSAS